MLGRIFQIFFVHILGNVTTSYFHSEINWPLVPFFLFSLESFEEFDASKGASVFIFYFYSKKRFLKKGPSEIKIKPKFKTKKMAYFWSNFFRVFTKFQVVVYTYLPAYLKTAVILIGSIKMDFPLKNIVQYSHVFPLQKYLCFLWNCNMQRLSI